jgi:predicted DNA-binding ribbon-helix-helix protein
LIRQGLRRTSSSSAAFSRLLKEAAEQRELHSARLLARVLLARIQHTSRNPARNWVAEAARKQSTIRTAEESQQHVTAPAMPQAAVPNDNHQRRRRKEGARPLS